MRENMEWELLCQQILILVDTDFAIWVAHASVQHADKRDIPFFFSIFTYNIPSIRFYWSFLFYFF